MSEQKFWLCFWSLMAIIVIACSAMITLYNIENDKTTSQTIKAAIDKGVDPIVARCAADVQLMLHSMACQMRK